MKSDLRYDAVIVGAGPAGSHLALRLAAEGLRVALVDRKHFPRHKPCGEFMSPECMPLLEQLGLRDAILAAGASSVSGMELHGHGVVAEGAFGNVRRWPGPAVGHALSREVLDDLAFRRAVAAAGVDGYPGHTVLRLHKSADGVVTGVEVRGPELQELRLTATCVVGADGLHSRVAREMGVRFDVPWLQKFAIVARFTGVAPRATAEVHYVGDGYMAACPVERGQFTLNLVVDRDRLPAGRTGLVPFLHDHIRRAPVLAARLREATLQQPLLTCGPLAGGTRAQVAPGVALVGDACGYVDPMTGEGLFFAMRGAALLADVLAPELRRGRCSMTALEHYQRTRRREFGRRYAMARLLQRGVAHPRVVKAVLATLAGRPALADLMVALTGESPRMGDILRPALWTRVLLPQLTA